MRTGLLAWLTLAGCSFRPGALPSDAPTGDDDVAITDDAPDAPDAPDASGGTTWTRRKPITVHMARVIGGPHAAFPVLLELASDAELAASARDDGFDLRFTAADGTTVLPYERCAFDGTTGRLRAWVAVPSISAAADTTFYIYYGNPTATDQQQRAATWAASYAGVWHLDGDGTDSTANANTATTMLGTTLGATGKVGTSARFDGVDDLLVMSNSAALDAVASAGTLSTWVNYDDATSTHQFLMASSNDITAPKSAFEWATQADGDHFFYPRRGDGDNAFNMVTNPFTNGTWHHVAVTLDFATTTVIMYVDGVAKPLVTANANSMWVALADPADWYWGGHTMYTAPFKGNLDEIRVVNVVRGPQWIATEHANQDNPGQFATAGSEEVF